MGLKLQLFNHVSTLAPKSTLLQLRGMALNKSHQFLWRLWIGIKNI